MTINNELSIVWHEPDYNPNTALWTVHAENLRPRHIEALYQHEVCRQSFMAPHRATGQATPVLSPRLVREYGAHRCWWLLREDIVERPVLLAHFWQQAIDEAMGCPNDDDSDIEGELL